MPDALLTALAGIHRTAFGDGHDGLRRVIRVLREMLTDRGHEEIEVAADALRCIDENEPVITTTTTEVYIHDEERVGIRAARAYAERMGDRSRMIVSVDGPTPVARREAQGLTFVLMKNVAYNCTRHHLVPRHRRTDKYADDRWSLPRILESDPVVQYYGWPVGTVVEIERTWGGHEPTVFHRVVSADVKS